MIKPPFLEAILGSTVNFSCTSWSKVEWSFNGRPVQPKAKQSGDHVYTLTIPKIELKDSGYYKCSGVSFDTANFFVAIADLLIFGKFFLL